MAEALYMNDSYLKEFEADVISVKDGKFVVLDKTAFYPSSGGQAHDTGVLIRKHDNQEFKVVFCGKFSGEISHEIAPVAGKELKHGDKITGKLDWERRYKLMRTHTACHVLCSVFHKETGALITGNQLDIDKSRIDFNLENFDREKIAEYANKANELLRMGKNVKTYFMPREDALKLPEMVKLATALPPNVPVLRIVEIESIDRQADGGTHVKNTSEVGEIEITNAENKGKNNRRVYFKLK